MVKDQRLAMDLRDSQKRSRNEKLEAEERVTDHIQIFHDFIFEHSFRSLGSGQKIASLLTLQFFILSIQQALFPSSEHHEKTLFRKPVVCESFSRLSHSCLAAFVASKRLSEEKLFDWREKNCFFFVFGFCFSFIAARHDRSMIRDSLSKRSVK